MSYRKVPAEIWASAGFRAMSPLPPSGQSLFLWVCAGPMTTNIPGIVMANRAVMATQLNWTQDAFDEALTDAMANGLIQFDDKAHLLIAPVLIERLPPEGPNIVRSWKKVWPLLPQCELLFDAERLMIRSLKRFNPMFIRYFQEVLAEAKSPNAKNAKGSVSPSKPLKSVSATTALPKPAERAPAPTPEPEELSAPDEDDFFEGDSVAAVAARMPASDGVCDIPESWLHEWVDEFPTLNIVAEIDRLQTHLQERDPSQRPKTTHMRYWISENMKLRKTTVNG